MTNAIIIKNPEHYSINTVRTNLLEPQCIIIVHPGQNIISKIKQQLEKTK